MRADKNRGGGEVGVGDQGPGEPAEAQEGGLILDEVNKALKVNVNAPLPRLNFARDILLTATSRWARELDSVHVYMYGGVLRGAVFLIVTLFHRET